MTDEKYVKQLEDRCEELENKVRHVYWRRTWKNSENYEGDISECDEIGIGGGCGPTCPVFQRGNCGCPEDIIEHMKELISYYDR